MATPAAPAQPPQQQQRLVVVHPPLLPALPLVAAGLLLPLPLPQAVSGTHGLETPLLQHLDC
jgi:hypothetical protein